MRDSLRDAGERVGCDAGLVLFREGGLKKQRRDDGDQVGVAATLADAVERALDLAHAGLDRGQRIGDGLAGVVMRVDAEMIARYARGDDRLHDGADLGRLRAAIGVAEHHPARAGVMGGLGAGQRVVGVRLVAVEEMFAVDQRFLARGDGGFDGGADGVEVFLVGAAERDADVIIPALGHEADGVRLRLDERGEAGIVGGRDADALGHAEGDELCAACACSAKKAVSVGLAPG